MEGDQGQAPAMGTDWTGLIRARALRLRLNAQVPVARCRCVQRERESQGEGHPVLSHRNRTALHGIACTPKAPDHTRPDQTSPSPIMTPPARPGQLCSCLGLCQSRRGLGDKQAGAGAGRKAGRQAGRAGKASEAEGTSQRIPRSVPVLIQQRLTAATSQQGFLPSHVGKSPCHPALLARGMDPHEHISSSMPLPPPPLPSQTFGGMKRGRGGWVDAC